MKKDPFIWIDKGLITTQQSNQIIKRFEDDKVNQYQGTVGMNNGENATFNVDLSLKNSKDLFISMHPNWEDMQNLFRSIVQKTVLKYINFLNEYYNLISFTTGSKYFIQPQERLGDAGFFIQKTSPGQGFTWHNDYTTGRLLTFILYLNTVEEGWTQFANGEQVAPELGKILIFPATWNYLHQGYPPKQTKYIMTGWLYE